MRNIIAAALLSLAVPSIALADAPKKDAPAAKDAKDAKATDKKDAAPAKDAKDAKATDKKDAKATEKKDEKKTDAPAKK